MYTNLELKLYVKKEILGDAIPLSDIRIEIIYLDGSDHDASFVWERLHKYPHEARNNRDILPSSGFESFSKVSNSDFNKFLTISKRNICVNSILRDIEES